MCEGLCRIPFSAVPDYPICTVCGALQPDYTLREAGSFWCVDLLLIVNAWNDASESPFKTFTCHVVTAFSLRLTRCQINDAKPGRTLAYREQRPSRAKHTEWTHVVSTAPPPKGWGRIQRIYLAWENRRTDPKWTAYKKSEVIRKFGPWMDFWMLKGIRKIPVQKTWTKYVVDRDWFRIRDGTPGPRGLKDCISVCQMLKPGQRVPGFGPKKRHQAAWTYGKFLSKKLVKKLLDY